MHMSDDSDIDQAQDSRNKTSTNAHFSNYNPSSPQYTKPKFTMPNDHDKDSKNGREQN